MSKNTNLDTLFIEESSKIIKAYHDQLNPDLTFQYDSKCRVILKSAKPLPPVNKVISKTLTSLQYEDGVRLIMRRVKSKGYYYNDQYTYLMEFRKLPVNMKFIATTACMLPIISILIITFNMNHIESPIIFFMLVIFSIASNYLLKK